VLDCDLVRTPNLEIYPLSLHDALPIFILRIFVSSLKNILNTITVQKSAITIENNVLPLIKRRQVQLVIKLSNIKIIIHFREHLMRDTMIRCQFGGPSIVSQ